MIPEKHPLSSRLSLRKEVFSVLSVKGSQKWKLNRGDMSQVDPVEAFEGVFLIVSFQSWFKTKQT